ncbi:hypothetical protein KI387_031547, partial [Taxus chinensis]
TQEPSQGKQQEVEPNREEMTNNLKIWAAKFGFTKIPLMVKPIEEVKVEEPVVDEAKFAAEEKDHIVLEAPSVEQATGEPSVLPSTSSPSRSDVEEEFELSNFMFEDEGSHGDRV